MYRQRSANSLVWLWEEVIAYKAWYAYAGGYAVAFCGFVCVSSSGQVCCFRLGLSRQLLCSSAPFTVWVASVKMRPDAQMETRALFKQKSMSNLVSELLYDTFR